MTKAMQRALLETYDKSLNLSDLLAPDTAMGNLAQNWKQFARIRNVTGPQAVIAVPSGVGKFIKLSGVHVNSATGLTMWMRLSYDNGVSFVFTNYDLAQWYTAGTGIQSNNNLTAQPEMTFLIGTTNVTVPPIFEAVLYLPSTTSGTRATLRSRFSSHDANGHNMLERHIYSPTAGRPTHILIGCFPSWHAETDIALEMSL